MTKQTTKAKARATAQEKLIENIRKYPTNIQAAIRLTAGQTKLNINQLHYMWYGNSKHGIKGLRSTEPVLISFTSEGMVQLNTKVASVIKSTKRTLKLNKELIDIKNLSVQMKAELLDTLLGL